MPNRASGHAVRCPLMAPENKDFFTEMLMTTSGKKGNSTVTARKERFIRVSRALIKNNIPFRVLDCPLFRAIHTDESGACNLPSRQYLSENCLPILSDRVTKDFQSSLASCDNRSLLGIVVTLANHKQYVLKLEDVSLVGHTSKAIESSIKEALSSIPPRKLNSLMSDSASNCVSARELVCRDGDFGYLIQHRCFAHWVNLIIRRVGECDEVRDLLGEALRLTTYFSNDTAIAATLTDSGQRRVRRSTPTRWCSVIDMLESLVTAKTSAQDTILAALERSDRSRDNQLLEAITTEASTCYLQL